MHIAAIFIRLNNQFLQQNELKAVQFHKILRYKKTNALSIVLLTKTAVTSLIKFILVNDSNLTLQI